MAGAMRKMAVYLGLVEDDGYDGRGFDPDDDFEPELEPEPERDRRRHQPPHQVEREEPVHTPVAQPPPSASLSRSRGQWPTRTDRPRGVHHT